MMFQFNVHISDQEYLDFNIFSQMKSPYFKKQFVPGCILYIVAILIIFAIHISANGIVKAFFFLILFSLPLLFFKKLFVWIIKNHIRSLKKRGKPMFTPDAILIFDENGFTESAPTAKTECTYSAIERISVVSGKAVYLHLNSLAAAILPLGIFESQQQYEEFMAFIKTKCATIDIY